MPPADRRGHRTLWHDPADQVLYLLDHFFHNGEERSMTSPSAVKATTDRPSTSRQYRSRVCRVWLDARTRVGGYLPDRVRVYVRTQ